MTAAVSDVDVARFARDGFLAFDQIAGPEAVAELAAVYDAMLSGEIDCSPTDQPLGRITRQIMSPSSYHPIFRDNEAFHRGREIAARLLGTDDPEPVFDMLIHKEPGQLATTPWHQDFAYREMPFTPAGRTIPSDQIVQFWTALDDVDEDNGCMHFLAGHHRQPLLAHHVAAGEDDYSQRLLAIVDPERALDLSKAVACPMRAGGATAHNYGTPHFTPGNRTADRARRAYIFNFATPAYGAARASQRRR